MASSNPWTTIKVLTLDIYGTLIDWESGIASSARATALGSFLPASHLDLMLEIEKHDTTIQRENPTMLQRDVIAEGLRRYAKKLGVVEKGLLSQAEVDEAATEYGGKIGEYPAFEDTMTAIQSLGKRYKLVPLTNVDRESFEGTITGPLEGCKFDAVYTAEDFGSYKPSLKNFHNLLDHLKEEFGLEKDDICHFTQSLFTIMGRRRRWG